MSTIPGPTNFAGARRIFIVSHELDMRPMMHKASVLLAAGVALLLSSHQADAFMAPAAMSLRAPSRMPVRPPLHTPTPKPVLIHGGHQHLMQPPMSV